jgi:uncharacterized membrane protein
MKKYFFTGLITLLPIALSIFLLFYIVELLTQPFAFLINDILVRLPTIHKILIMIGLRIAVLIVLFLLTTLIGFLISKAFVKGASNLIQKIFQKIPVIKSIYNISRELFKAMFNPESKFFKETVVIKFPSEHSYGIGFITGDVPFAIQNLIPEADTVVFIPTAPHPIQGFLLLTKKSDTITIPLSTEDTFKLLISCGAISPTTNELKPEPENHEDTHE